MTVPRVEMEDVEAIIPMTVKSGRVNGLTEYEGRRVLIVVTGDTEPKPSRKRGSQKGGAERE